MISDLIVRPFRVHVEEGDNLTAVVFRNLEELYHLIEAAFCSYAAYEIDLRVVSANTPDTVRCCTVRKSNPQI